MREWSIQNAQNQLSELIAATSDGPQAIYDRGRRAAVVLSAEDFARLTGGSSLLEFFGSSGLDEVEFGRVGTGVRNT